MKAALDRTVETFGRLHERAVTARLKALQADLHAIRRKIEKDDRRHSFPPHQEAA